MDNNKSKTSYLQLRAEQMHQWERVIDKLKSRADKVKDKNNTELRNHIVKIQVKKARTEVQLRQLQEAGAGKWDDIKVGVERSWSELRKAFLKASARPK